MTDLDSGRRRRVATGVARVVLFLLLISPFLANAIAHRGDQFIFDNIYQLNIGAYLARLREGGDFIIQGNYSSSYLFFAPFFLVIKGLSWLFSPAEAYIVLFILLYGLAFTYWRKYLRLVVSKDGRVVVSGWSIEILPEILSFIMLSSLSFYIYFNNSIFPQIGYFFLPVLLYQAHWYVREATWWRLLLIWLVMMLILPTNLAYILIDIILLNLLTFIMAPPGERRQTVKRLLLIDLIIGLVMAWVVVVMYQSMIGDVSQVSSIYAESFYSDNANLSTTLRQVSDWGFFLSWRGQPYYEYAAFYQQRWAMLIGLLPYAMLIWLHLDWRFKKKARDYWLLLLTVGLVVFMQGSNNPFFAWLYEHVTYFQVFRNVAKWSFALLFLVLFQIFLLIMSAGRTKRKVSQTVVIGLLLIFGSYNLPFWTKSDSFFSHRLVKEIPSYWYEAADYVNTNLDSSSKILLLPAVYIGDSFKWDGQDVLLKSYLADVLFQPRSYRLSELFTGGVKMQQDMNSLYIDSNATDRGKEIRMSRLDGLLARYNIDYFIVTHDLISDYQTLASVDRWAAQSGYAKTATFGELTIYRRADRHEPIVTAQSASVKFQRDDNFHYSLAVKNLRVGSKVVFDDYYHSGWRLMTTDSSISWVSDETDGRTNCWTVTSERFDQLRQSSGATVNSDNTVNIDLVIDYHPRRAIGRAFQWTMSGALLIIILAAGVENRRRHRNTIM